MDHQYTMVYTYWWERCNLGLLIKVHNRILHVVDSHTTIGTLKTSIGSLCNALIGTVIGLEVHNGGPVIGKVLRELAGRASSLVNEFALSVHSRVECILYPIVSQK
jgi:hypothetical protein